MDNRNKTILIVDDEDYTCTLIRKLLGGKGYNVIVAKNGNEAIETFQETAADVVLLDQRMPGLSGLQVLEKLKSLESNVAVIMMTGFGTVEEAVTAMRLGAFHYITKPFNNLDEVELLIERALKEKLLEDENRYLRDRLDRGLSFEGVVGKSKAMVEIMDLVKKVAPLHSTILVHGETGTGKELLAKTIHQNSERADKKFIAINCGALTESLLESSLFGFEKGAFTGAVKTTPGYFEEADGGTIFLDEITGTSLKLQTSLLRVLQEKEFSRIGETARRKTDFRLIAASNDDMEKEVAEGRFREDLFYRINVIPLNLPPLRERKDDIPFLANYFLKQMNNKLGKSVGPFSLETIELMEEYDWKGNVREMENLVERVVALKQGDKIEPYDLPPHLFKERIQSIPASIHSDLPFQEAKDHFEKLYLEEILKKTNGNISKASEITGIKRQNLYIKINRHGLRRNEA
ncbi:MAG: sigma-54 dependent transcriptional regulator [Deltaproteobacteria bacterium]|nr:sigma-54 dependent transcriptional regulator [Deltaproteobacteria bacterium]